MQRCDWTETTGVQTGSRESTISYWTDRLVGMSRSSGGVSGELRQATAAMPVGLQLTQPTRLTRHERSVRHSSFRTWLSAVS